MVTVPTLAIAAHGIASGVVPGLRALALCLIVGVLAGACCRPRCSALSLLAVLSAAQLLSHLALALAMPASASMPMGSMSSADLHTGSARHSGPMRDISDHFVEMLHFGSADGMTMVLTHLIAIPLCAMLIAAAVAVYTVITSVVAALADGPAPLARHIITVVECETVARWNRIDRAAGAGERGPPPLFA